MIPIIAWRNIWRNRTRSWVVICAIALGVWAALFMSGFATGMSRGYVRTAIENIVSHIQIHHPKFKDDFDIHYTISGVDAVAEWAHNNPEVNHLSFRTISNGMLANSKGARGVQIKGINPPDEALVTALDAKVVEGKYLDTSRHNEILIGRELAEKLKIKVRSKVILTFQDFDNEITSGAFRVAGFFDSGSKPFNELHVFVRDRDLSALLMPQYPDTTLIHETAFLLHDSRKSDEVSSQLKTLQSESSWKVETYREVSPDLQLYESQINTASYIYLVVIMLALVFGIVNTMLMAVLERIREIGMLMAVGMNKWRVFMMIALESIMLGFVAAPLGLLLGWVTMLYLGRYGIDLSAYSESLKMYGMAHIVYFEVDKVVYMRAGVAVTLTAFLAALYPAWRATRLRPVEAIRKI